MLQRLLLVAIALLGLLIGIASIQGQPTLNITASLNKQTYVGGDTVIFSGKVTDPTNGNGVANAIVSYEVDGPGGGVSRVSSTIADSSGSFSDTFSVSSGSTNGQYTIFATASKPGYSDGHWQSGYTVIPEMPLQASLFVLLFTLLGASLLVRRANANRPEHR